MEGTTTEITRVEEPHGDYNFVIECRDGVIATFKELVGRQQPEALPEPVAPDELPSAYLRHEYNQLSVSV